MRAARHLWRAAQAALHTIATQPGSGSVAASSSAAPASAAGTQQAQTTLTLIAAVPAALLAGASTSVRCDQAEDTEAGAEPVPGEASNAHTAKFRIYSDKARRCTVEGRFADAEAWWGRARDEAIAGFGEDDAHLAVIANGLAEVYRCAGGDRFARAEALYRESVAIVEREYGTMDVRYAQAVQYLGQYLSDAGRHAEALREIRKAAEVKKATLGKAHVEYAAVVGLLGDAHRAAGDYKPAVRSFEESLAIMAISGHDEGSAASKTRSRLVDTLLEAGNAEKALEVVEGMLGYARNVHITEHGVTMCCLENVVAALAAKGRAHRAVRAAEAMLEARVLAFGDASVSTGLPRRVLASALLDATGASRHAMAALQAYLAAQAFSNSVQKLGTEVESLRAIPSWAFWRTRPDNLEFMKLRVTVETIELAKALLVLQLPAARANARYAATLKPSEREAMHIPAEAGRIDEGELHRMMVLCRARLEAPERILEPWESEEGSSAVRVPRKQAWKVECGRLEALGQLLDAEIDEMRREKSDVPRYSRKPEDARVGASAAIAPLQRRRQELQAQLDKLRADEVCAVW